MDKRFEYAQLINNIIVTLLHSKEIDFSQPENADAFFIAICSIVPCNIYNKITGEDLSLLEFNAFISFLISKQ